MKIGIMTISSQNMGNRLQNYAVQEVLKKLGAEVETLDNDYCGREVTTFKHTLKICVLGRTLPSTFRKRREGFYRFTEEHIKVNNRKFVFGKAPEGIAEEFDFFVCGSDQIWNPTFDFISSNEFLAFARPEQKIAYAASLGVPSVSREDAQKLKEYIRDYRAISVREEAGAGIVRETTGREAQVLIDPTMMLSRKEWLRVAKKPEFFPERKYILTYFLGTKLPETQELLVRLAKERNLELVDLWDIRHKKYFLADPSHFIYLIANCELMCTDSFHGSVFSILMGVPFVVQGRKDEAKNMNSRIETLLGRLSLEEHFMDDEFCEENVFCRDYERAYRLIGKEQENAWDFLKKSLGL